MNLPEEHCENCGKAISRRARANVFGERVLCTPCYNKAKNELARREERDNRPATSGQLKFLKDLGFSSVDNFTFDQASSTLDHAQQIRYFAFKIARQEWGLDLTGSDLRPIVHVAFNDSAMRDRIYNTMQQVHDAAYERQSQMDAANINNAHYEQPFIGDVEPPLNPRDPDYIKVRAGLIALGFGRKPGIITRLANLLR